MNKLKELISYLTDLDTLFYKVGSVLLCIMLARYILRGEREHLLFTAGLALIFIDCGW